MFQGGKKKDKFFGGIMNKNRRIGKLNKKEVKRKSKRNFSLLEFYWEWNSHQDF